MSSSPLADWKLVFPFWSDRVMEEAEEAIRRDARRGKAEGFTRTKSG